MKTAQEIFIWFLALALVFVILSDLHSIKKRIEALENPCEKTGYQVIEYGKGLTNCGDTIPIPPIKPLKFNTGTGEN